MLPPKTPKTPKTPKKPKGFLQRLGAVFRVKKPSRNPYLAPRHRSPFYTKGFGHTLPAPAGASVHKQHGPTRFRTPRG